MRKIQEVLSRYSIMTLKDMLGQALIDLIEEWSVDREFLLDPAALAKFYIETKLSDVLKSTDFVNKLIDHLNRKEIEEIGSDLKIKSPSYENVKSEVSKNNKKKKEFFKFLDVEDLFTDIKTSDSDKISVSNITNDSQFYELFDYQEIIKQRALNLLNDKTKLRRMLIQMPTGTGKTKTAIHTLINYYVFSMKKQGLILWIAHSKELLEQALDTFVNVWSHLGNGEVNIYRLWGKFDPFKEIEPNRPINGIMFAGIQKLNRLKGKEEFEEIAQNCRLIVYDEAHQSTAPEYRKTVEKLMNRNEGYPDRSLIGLTATPGRTTSYSIENDELSEMYEGKLITIDTKLLSLINYGEMQARNIDPEEDIIKYFQERGVLSKIKKEQLSYTEEMTPAQLEELKACLSKMTGQNYTGKQLQFLAQNKNRNLAILKRLRELNAQKIPTIVFAVNVEHAKTLAALLRMENITSSLVLGETPTALRKQEIEDFKKGKTNIIINYGALTTGFDSKNIGCVFITRPTNSIVLYSQMIGRGLRGPLMGGNEECLLIDVKDNLGRYNTNTAYSHFNDYWS